ncbi:hypothetical protein TNCV_2227671 [Trichonephila clavipes]|nr:hypothetical protein TNCV_2227671 [Trichonephila clavipes]
MPPDRATSDRGVRNGKGLVFMHVISHIFEHQTGDSSIWLGSTPNFEGEHPGSGGLDTSHLSFPSTNLSKRLTARRIFRVSPCLKGTLHLKNIPTFPGIRTQAILYSSDPQPPVRGSNGAGPPKEH